MWHAITAGASATSVRKNGRVAQLLTKRTEVEAGPLRVWSVLTDPAHMATWMPGVDRVDAVPPIALDSSLTLGLGSVERTATIVAFEEAALMALRTVSRGVATVYRYEVEADGNSAVVTVTIDVRPASLWGWFVTPLARRAIRQVDKDHGELIRTTVLDAPW